MYSSFNLYHKLREVVLICLYMKTWSSENLSNLDGSTFKWQDGKLKIRIANVWRQLFLSLIFPPIMFIKTRKGAILFNGYSNASQA